jgi:hypothetical protein
VLLLSRHGAELDGNVWEPVPGATVTAEDFITARSLILEIHQQASWSPWVLEDHAQEYDAAWGICGQWKHRTGPAAQDTRGT